MLVKALTTPCQLQIFKRFNSVLSLLCIQSAPRTQVARKQEGEHSHISDGLQLVGGTQLGG